MKSLMKLSSFLVLLFSLSFSFVSCDDDDDDDKGVSKYTSVKDGWNEDGNKCTGKQKVTVGGTTVEQVFIGSFDKSGLCENAEIATIYPSEDLAEKSLEGMKKDTEKQNVRREGNVIIYNDTNVKGMPKSVLKLTYGGDFDFSGFDFGGF